MKRNIIFGVISLVLFVLIVLIVQFQRNFFNCQNDVISTHPSPSGALNAILFKRDCGATTLPSYSVIVLSTSRKFDYNSDRIVFTCTDLTDAKIAWSADGNLNINIRCDDVYKKERSIDGISIAYSE